MNAHQKHFKLNSIPPFDTAFKNLSIQQTPNAMHMKKICLFGALLIFAAAGAQAEQVGEVSTEFKLLGANHKIVIEAFDDPDIPGATCYVSRAKTGGIKGSLGLAEDTADASIACRQTGPIALPKDVSSGKRDGERVFRKSTSILFKTLQVVRFYDQKRNVLVYLSYSDKLINGSPKNSISAIEIRPWRQEGPAAEQIAR